MSKLEVALKPTTHTPDPPHSSAYSETEGDKSTDAATPPTRVKLPKISFGGDPVKSQLSMACQLPISLLDHTTIAGLTLSSANYQ